MHNKIKYFGKNMEMIGHLYVVVYYIYLFGQCHCGFWFFFCFVLDMIQTCNADKTCLELHSPCISLKIHILERSSANQIQAINGPVVIKCNH